jgi:hypothetical protein
MKQLTLVLLFLATANAWADWTLVGEGEIKEGRLTVYADRETIGRAGDFAKMRSLFDFSIPKLLGGKGEYRSVKFQEEFDCSQRRFRVLSLDWYADNMSRGEPIASTSVGSEWKPVSPGSVDEAVWEAACTQ